MNEIYKRNLDILEKKYPHVYEKIINIKENKIDVLVDVSKDGNKYMIINNQNKKMYINSRYRPVDEAKKWSESIEIKEKSKIILMGFGIGYRIKEFIKKLSTENFLTIIEPSIEVFSEAIKNIDCRDIFSNDRLQILVDEDVENISKIISKHINSYNLNNIFTTIMPNYINIFKENIDMYMKLIENKLTDEKLNRNTILRQGLMWYSNFVNNIPSICNSVNLKNFINEFKDKPAVIVSAGPSLSKNVHLLKDIKDKVLIICVGTVLKVLLNQNIRPDIVVAMDAKHQNYNHFKNIDFDDIPLLYSPKIFPSIPQKHRGDKIIFSDYEAYAGKTIYGFYDDVEPLHSGGSVAHSALGFAQKIGANPIVFIGQDLAYKDKKTHAEGTVYENEGLDEENVVEVEGVYGEKVLAKIEWHQFLLWMEKSIKKDNDETNRIYIDATEGGAKIHGTHIMTFQEAIDKYCIENIEVRKKLKDMIEKNRESLDIKDIIKDLRSIKFEIDEIKLLSKRIMRLYEEIKNLHSSNIKNNEYEINKMWRKVTNLENEIKRKTQGLLTIESIAMVYINLLDNKANDEMDETLKEIENNKRLYLYIKECGEYIYYLIEDFLKEYQEEDIKILKINVNISD